MTASISGFLAPEERAAVERRTRFGHRLEAAEVPGAVIRALQDGPLTLTELVAEVHASPRLILSAIDEFEKLVKMSHDDNEEEIIDLTDAGHRIANLMNP